MISFAPSPAISLNSAPQSLLLDQATTAPVLNPQDDKIQEKFQEFVAGTFYKQMLKAMRSSQKPPAYLNGGQAEKIFQSQLDDIVTTSLAKRDKEQFAEPLFSQFALQHPGLAPQTGAGAAAELSAL